MGPATLQQQELQRNSSASKSIDKRYSSEVSSNENDSYEEDILCYLDRVTFRSNVEVDNIANSPTNLLPSYIQNITRLDLSARHLTDFPSIVDLPSLIYLNVSRNDIKELPSTLKSAIRLRELDISHNQLKEFPSVLINNLAMIKTLTLSHNSLKSIPKPSCFQHLKELNASNCQIQTFPLWIIYDRHWLEALDLSHNHVFSFVVNERACFHASMQWMRKLNLANTQMTDKYNYVLRRFTKLRELDISNYQGGFHNRFDILARGLPDSLEKLKAVNLNIGSNPILRNVSLVEVDLSTNPLSWIDSNFISKTLKTVVISKCAICSLPEDFGDMEHLEILILSYNDLCALPASFSSLSRLQYLDLYYNSFSSLPNVLREIRSLTSLDICQNHFDPFAQPLELNQLSYNDLRTSLRAQLSESRASGPVPNPSAIDDELRDESYSTTSSSDSYFDEEWEEESDVKDENVERRVCERKPEEVGWDSPDEDVVCNDRVSELNCPIGPAYVGNDSNLFFSQYLHLVPDYIRDSPLYYHRIDLSQQLTLPPPRSVEDYDTVEGQFDD